MTETNGSQPTVELRFKQALAQMLKGVSRIVSSALNVLLKEVDHHDDGNSSGERLRR
jgi:hypothetical protein